MRSRGVLGSGPGRYAPHLRDYETPEKSVEHDPVRVEKLLCPFGHENVNTEFLEPFHGIMVTDLCATVSPAVSTVQGFRSNAPGSSSEADS
ncbi:MAG: hypothetical protein V2B18_14695, partial [Pseudomonadota bacterium]